MRALLLTTLLAAASTVHAHALTDTWWTPDESGWGLTAMHENNQLNITLFVHDGEGRPHWYTAALTRYGSTQAGDDEFSGVLYETRGSVPTAPWNPAAVQHRVVGRAEFRARPDGRAELDYSLDGVSVRKSLQRLQVQRDRMVGLHFGTLLPSYEGCPNDFVGLKVFERGTLNIDRCADGLCTIDPPPGSVSAPISLTFNDGARLICQIDAEFFRHGRSGDIKGSYQCDDGGSGAIEFSDIEYNSVGFTSRFSAEHPQCAEFRGIFSAIRSDERF